MNLDRRNFLKATALTAASAALHQSLAAEGTPQAHIDMTALNANDGLSWQKAPCRFCGTGCHVQVGVADGKVKAIAGDIKAEVNKGLLCAKGYHVGSILYGEDRLTTPLLRNADGIQEPISWERAIGIIADRVELDTKGFAIYGSGQWTIPEGYAAMKFLKGGLSSNHLDPNARLCMASAVTGFLATYGVDEPNGCYDDLDTCDTLITWGNNPAEMHPILFSRVMDRRSRGETVTLIDIGTRRTRTTDHADEFLQIKPQGDLALANGIAHQLLKNDSYDHEFVQKHCRFREDGSENGKPGLFGKTMGFTEYVKALESYTPDYVEELTGIPADKIIMLGKIFGDSKKKITSLWCMGMNQHTRGTAINTLVHGIHLLSGHFGTPGDNPTSLTGQPSACGTCREVGTLAHTLPGGRIVKKESHRRDAEEYWNLPEGRINAKPGHHTIKMWKKFCTPSNQGGDISTIWVQVTNPAQTLPNRHLLAEKHRDLDEKFLIVSDVYPTETTRMADLVLPSALWVEKNGVVGNSERRTQQWFKMVTPPGEARDDAWQIIAVAKELHTRKFPGMLDKDGQFIFHTNHPETGKEFPIWDWNHYYDINVDEQLFEEYRQFTRLKHKDLAPYSEYVKTRGMRWPVVQQKDGSWQETRYRFSEFSDPYVKKGSGISFYHSSTKDDKAQIWFRPYEAPPESPDTDYPFWLCTGRVLEHWHSGSMTMRVPQLRNAVPSSYVELHPEDARKLNISQGEKVKLTSRRGEITLNVWINGRGKPPQGTLFVPFFDENILINKLTLHDYDPFSKQPDYKKCAVRISKV